MRRNRSSFRRLVEELRAEYSESDVERALTSLVLRRDEDAWIVSRGEGGEPLFPIDSMPSSRVRIEPGVYATTPSRRARVRLLQAVASASLAPRVEVHAPVSTESAHRSRLVIDNTRRALRALGLSTAEPGDRFAWQENDFLHVFFDDEALIAEAEQAGLAFIVRRGPWIVLERRESTATERAAPFAREVVRALRVIGEANRRRRHDTPRDAVFAMRARGRRAPARGPIGRSRLRRAIGWVDAAFPTGPNCFRRTLAEVALDAGAANETLVFGLNVGKTGHVAFKDAEDHSFDVAFEIPP